MYINFRKRFVYIEDKLTKKKREREGEKNRTNHLQRTYPPNERDERTSLPRQTAQETGLDRGVARSVEGGEREREKKKEEELDKVVAGGWPPRDTWHSDFRNVSQLPGRL